MKRFKAYVWGDLKSQDVNYRLKLHHELIEHETKVLSEIRDEINRVEKQKNDSVSHIAIFLIISSIVLYFSSIMSLICFSGLIASIVYYCYLTYYLNKLEFEIAWFEGDIGFSEISIGELNQQLIKDRYYPQKK